MTTEERLREREKELACIYSICLLAAGAPEPEAAAEGIARALCSAMHYEDRAACEVSFARSGGPGVSVRRGWPAAESAEASARLESALPTEAAADWTGTVRLEYRDPGLGFLSQEKALLDSVLVVAASMLRTSSLIAELRAASRDLAAKNVALREMVSMIEDERRRALVSFRERLTGELLPLAERVRDGALSPERRDGYAALLADELGRDIAALGAGPSVDPALSPREREIAVQVRNGRTSKEIAELLGISPATVERHRHNIRRKLRLPGRNVNLASLLNNDDAPSYGALSTEAPDNL